MTTMITNHGKLVEFDLSELDDRLQFRGDADTISAIRNAVHGSTMLVPGGDDPMPVDHTTPLHNVIAAALSLGMRVGDTELSTAASLPQAVRSTSQPVTATADTPAVTRVVMSLEEFLASQAGAAVVPVVSGRPADATEINYIGTPASAPSPTLSPEKFTLVSAPVPPVNSAFTAASGTAVSASFDLGDDDPLTMLLASLDETESTLFSDMVRRMGLVPRTQR